MSLAIKASHSNIKNCNAISRSAECDFQFPIVCAATNAKPKTDISESAATQFDYSPAKMHSNKSKKSLGNGLLSKIDQFFSNKRNNRELFVIYDTRKWRMVRETRAFGVLCVNTVYLFSNRFVFFLFLSNKKLIQGEKSKMATIDRDSLCVQEWNGIDYSTNTKRTS